MRRATLEEIAWVHSYARELQRVVAEEAPTSVADEGDPDGVTYVTPSSWDDALLAAGTAMSLVDAVVEAAAAAAAAAAGGEGAGAVEAGAPGGGATSSSSGAAAFAATRPPGHHATRDTPLGYCLLNNVALATRHAQRRHGFAKVRRVRGGTAASQSSARSVPPSLPACLAASTGPLGGWLGGRAVQHVMLPSHSPSFLPFFLISPMHDAGPHPRL